MHFVFNEAKGKSGIRRNTNWMISAVSSCVSFCCIVVTLFAFGPKTKVTEGRAKSENKIKVFFAFLAFLAKLKFILLLEILDMRMKFSSFHRGISFNHKC